MNTPWKTKPISRTCEVLARTAKVHCGKPTARAYQASGGGWMALCEEHGEKHSAYADPIEVLLANFQTMLP